MLSRAVACLLFVFALPGTAASGQVPGARVAPSAARVTSRIVEVSVVAEDKQGRPVVDLTADDLVLSDGGHPERIASFSLQPPIPTRTAALPPGTFTNRLDQLAGGSPSVTAILFDGLNTLMARQSYARRASRSGSAATASRRPGVPSPGSRISGPRSTGRREP